MLEVGDRLDVVNLKINDVPEAFLKESWGCFFNKWPKREYSLGDNLRDWEAHKALLASHCHGNKGSKDLNRVFN